MNDNRVVYYKNHSLCPICGSKNIESTTMGVLLFDIEGDTNKANCLDCGWNGIVDNLKLDEKETNSNPIREPDVL